MNFLATHKRFVTNTIGALMVTAALATGATLGDFTTPDLPAHAETPQRDNHCGVLCTDPTAGKGGVTNTIANGKTHRSGGGNINR